MGDRQIQVDVNTIDDYCREIGAAVDFVKLDIEVLSLKPSAGWSKPLPLTTRC